MHCHAAARDEWRPEEPEQDAFDERRHERGRGGAAGAAPDAAPESARAHANDAGAVTRLSKIFADIVGELAGTDIFMLRLGLDVARRIEDHVAAIFKRRLHDVAESARDRGALRRAVLAQVGHRHRAKRAQHGRRHNARVEKTTRRSAA